MKKFSSCVISLLLSIIMIAAAFPVLAFAEGEEHLLQVGAETEATSTSNAFIGVNGGSDYDGISLSEDYGSDALSVSLISRERDRFIIELNGHTLTLAYLALNMTIEVRGEGTLVVKEGIVIYTGELYLGAGVRLETEAELPVIAHGEGARIRIGRGASVSGGDRAVAELGIRYEYKDEPIVFEALPSETDETTVYRVLYENCAGETPVISDAAVARFPTAEDAALALERGVLRVVNPLSGSDTESEEDDAFYKLSGDTVVVKKNGAMLSHANLSLDGAIAVNFYFELSGIDGSIESLGALVYSGVGEGGRIEIPEKGADGKYKFTVPISPKDMGKSINMRFEGDESGKAWDYSVVKYARYILSDTEGVFGRELKDLIASMLTYGAAIQRLNGETEQLADEVLTEFPEYSSDEKIREKTDGAINTLYSSGYAHKRIYYKDPEASPVTFDRFSLAVGDDASIRVYLKDGYSADKRYSFSVSYNEVSAGGSVYEMTKVLSASEIWERGFIQISGVSSAYFNRVFRVSVKSNADGEPEALCELTALTYARELYERSEVGSVERALAEAMIWYGISSVSYFSAAALVD